MSSSREIFLKSAVNERLKNLSNTNILVYFNKNAFIAMNHSFLEISLSCF